MTTSVTRRVAEIEEALARALRSGDFEVVTYDGERYLAPVLTGHVSVPDAIISYPLLSLDQAARELERLLS